MHNLIIRFCNMKESVVMHEFFAEKREIIFDSKFGVKFSLILHANRMQFMNAKTKKKIKNQMIAICKYLL